MSMVLVAYCIGFLLGEEIYDQAIANYTKAKMEAIFRLVLVFLEYSKGRCYPFLMNI